MTHLRTAAPVLGLAVLGVSVFGVSASALACNCAAAKAQPTVETVAVAKYDASKGEAASIAHADLVKAIKDKKVTVIDVNGPEVYKAGHIPGAVHFGSLQGKELEKALPKDKNALIVAYCGSEHCGAYKQGVKAAARLGYTNIQHYSPGIKGWKASGEAVEKN